MWVPSHDIYLIERSNNFSSLKLEQLIRVVNHLYLLCWCKLPLWSNGIAILPIRIPLVVANYWIYVSIKPISPSDRQPGTSQGWTATMEMSWGSMMVSNTRNNHCITDNHWVRWLNLELNILALFLAGTVSKSWSTTRCCFRRKLYLRINGLDKV